MEKILHKRIFVGTKANGRGIVKATAQLYILGGNQHPYFSITTGNGCQHDLILESMPHLKPLVDIHLSDDKGRPTYWVENGAYYLSETDAPALARHLRIPANEARSLIDEFTWYFKDYVKENSQIQETVRNGWNAVMTRYTKPERYEYFNDNVNWAHKTGMAIQRWLKGSMDMRRLHSEDIKAIAKLMKFGDMKLPPSAIKRMADRHSFTWPSLQKILKQLDDINDIVLKALARKLDRYTVAQEYMKELIDSCFLPCWQRQADHAIEMLQGEDQHLEVVPEEGEMYVIIDGETILVEDTHDYGHLPELDLGDRTYIVARTSEEAGEAAREYWVDMAKNDYSEFSCIVGEESLIKWGMGEIAGPGSSQVASLEDWFDLHLTHPEEQWASYDSTEVQMQIDRNTCDAIGFDFEGDINDDTMTVVAYRS